MCFFQKQTASVVTLENRFNAKFDSALEYVPSKQISAFQFSKTPVISNNKTNAIQLYNWGLIPHWAKDHEIRKATINARIETIHEKPSFRNAVKNRCLVLTEGFYEWKWLDEKGKKKQKYFITLPDSELFGFAGLWDTWLDRSTGEIIHSYTILTTEANELMAEIHNTKRRMPVIISKDFESSWLSGLPLPKTDVELSAVEVS